MRELEVPNTAKIDEDAFEILRVWIANQQQHVSIRIGVWNDPMIWGMMLADLARHLANAYNQQHGYSFDNTVNRIREGFDVELDSPTDFPSGGIVDN